MKFSDLFVPRFLNSNPEVRKKAIMKLEDPKLIAQIVEREQDDSVRQVAANRLVMLTEAGSET